MSDYPGQERRAKPPPITRHEVEEIIAQHELVEKKNLQDQIDVVMRAFPNGDVDGHCNYHNAKIKAAQAEEQFWQSARSEALKHGVAGLFAVLKFVVILTMLGAAYKVGLGPAVAKLLGVAP